MKKIIKWLVLACILLSYAFLYIATSKDYVCKGDCEKIQRITEALMKNRPYVYGTFRCSYTELCVYVNDSIQRDWKALADTACMYTKDFSLANDSIIIISNPTRDTLLKNKCP